MANVFRAPLVVRGDTRRFQPAVQQGSSRALLGAVLVALPIIAGHVPPAQVQAKAPRNLVNADTSRGSPRALLSSGQAAKPVAVAPFIAVQPQRVLPVLAFVPSLALTQTTTVSLSSATTDGADVLAAAVGPIVAGTSATTDGADVLSAQVGPIVSSSSATTDGADVLAANVSIGTVDVSLSSATTDGADVLAANVGPIVAASSATTDGADTLAGAVGPIVGATSAMTDGADVLAAQVNPFNTVSMSAALVEGEDVAAGRLDTGAPQGAGASSSSNRKKKVAIQRRDGKIELFESEQEAENWLKTQAPKLEKAVAKLARKIAKTATQAAPTPILFEAPVLLSGTEELRAVVNMRAGLLQQKLDEEIARQIAQQEDDDMAAAVVYMMS